MLEIIYINKIIFLYINNYTQKSEIYMTNQNNAEMKSNKQISSDHWREKKKVI